MQSEVICIDPFPPERRPTAALSRGVERLLKMAFLSRRKMLRNTLAPVGSTDLLQSLAEEAGISLQQRPQDVAPEAWVALAKGLNQVDSVA